MAVSNLPLPVFFDTDEAQIIAEATAFYEGLVGKQLAPTQTEQMIINTFAYRELTFRIAANEACMQNLLAFASYPMIDYLGDEVGVTRLPAGSATCSMVFTMQANNPALVIPAGVRIQSTDGKAVFITLADLPVSANTATATVTCEATNDGAFANGYQPGDISVILDPQAFVASAANADVTNSGSDQETDDALRARIRLAPSSFSCAGPDDAYIYFAKSADPTIIDVKLLSPTPGSVALYVLVTGGAAPSSEIIAKVQAACNPDKARPLNDIVTVNAPTAVDYAISVDITTLTNAIDGQVQAAIATALNAYALMRQTNLGIDVVVSQIEGKCMENLSDQVYKAVVTSPSADISMLDSQYGVCTGISVNIIGTSPL